MNFGLKGKVAVVAASSKGLGKAVAFEFAKEGMNIVICARTEETLKRTAEEIRNATGANVEYVVADVKNADDIKKVVKTAIDKFGTVHVLVNNAGGPPAGYFMDFKDDDWYDAFTLNFMSAVRFIREVLPYMQKQRWGRIINITSISVKQPIDNLILSNSIRLAIIGMAKTLSNQVGEYNITINNVCPGITLTDRVRNLAEITAKQKKISVDNVFEQWAKEIPMRRIGQPSDLAALITFLASERASFITGTTIQVDGGQIKFVL
ncbi:MAG: SDR family oxidoreductase [Candidatus Asgardarchaeia archaeon]